MSAVTAEMFLADVAQHEVRVELNSGVHRSILFKRKGSGNMYFRLTTWNNHLAISGDMGCYVFSRTEDMFEFFRGELKINLNYWCEKLQAISCFGSKNGDIREYDSSATVAQVDAYFRDCNFPAESLTGVQMEVLDDVYHAEDDRAAAKVLVDADIDDAHCFLTYNPTYHIQWCLYAVVWGIQQYDALQAQTGQPVPAILGAPEILTEGEHP